MTQLLDIIYSVAIVTTLWATAIGFGAGHDLGAVGAGLRRRGLFVRLIALDVVLVPLLVLGLIRLFGVPTEYALGLLIVATASAGPLGLKSAQIARGDLPLAIALVIVLEFANIVAVPVWAALIVPGGTALPLAAVVGTLVAGVLVPLLLGFAIHGGLPRHAAIVERWAAPISTFSLAILIGVVLVRDGATALGAIGSGVPGVAIATILVALGLGWWLGGPDQATRRSSALVSSVRANTVALAVAGTAFGANSPATSAIVVFGLCSLVVAPLAALAIGRRADRAGRTAYAGYGSESSRSRSAPTS